MFHSHAWVSFCDAAPKFNASAMPWLLAGLTATLLMLLVIERASPSPSEAKGHPDCIGAVDGAPSIAPAPSTCAATSLGGDDMIWYPVATIGDLLANH